MNDDNYMNNDNRDLNEDEQKVALKIARETIKAVFNKQDYQPEIDQYPIFNTKRGAFVTLHLDKQLRGCIGIFEANKPLVETIQEMVISAAFNDSRFNPLTKDELEQVEIEISVLSPLEKITDPNIIEVGKHGVLIRQGNKGGVYLPQVATEAGWSREEFLDHLCEHKAGISRDAWRDGSAKIYVFTAQIFNE